MEELELYEALARLRDWLYQAADLAETLDKAVQKKTKTVTGPYSIEKINFQQMSGSRGPYDMANDNNNKGNTDYQTLKEDLKAHGGRMRRGKEFMWLFQDGTAIGKKTLAPKTI